VCVLTHSQAAVYGTQQPGTAADEDADGEDAEGDDSDDDAEDGELFRAKSSGTGDTAAEIDTLDSSRRALLSGVADSWAQPDALESIRNRFVTGDWEAGSREGPGSGAPGQDGDDDGGDAYGDFEDLEAAEQPAAEADDAETLRLRKAALKAQFDAEHDLGGRHGASERAGNDRGGRTRAAPPPAEEEQETFYDMRKREMAEEQALTRTELAKLHPSVREALEGHSPGAYMRICLERVSCELVQHFDPAVPLLLGGLLPNEQTMVFVQVSAAAVGSAAACVPSTQPRH
jgi:ribosome biogenesis protein BMS1